MGRYGTGIQGLCPVCPIDRHQAQGVPLPELGTAGDLAAALSASAVPDQSSRRSTLSRAVLKLR